MRGRWMLVLALPIVLGPAAGSADAASCKVMTVGYAFSSGSVIALEPTHQDIAFQGCVQFTNNLDLGVTITVAGGYSVTLGPKESTPPKKAYVGTAAGRHNVTARSGPSSADGSITVAAPPASPKSPSKSPTHRATPKHTTPPQPTTAHPSSTSTGPRVAPVPPTVGAHIPKRRQQSPPGPAPSVAPTTPVPVPTPTPRVTRTPAVVSFPVEPPSGRGAGLPGAVAALAVVGTGAGLVRVLLAEPWGAVDGRRRDVAGSA